MITLLVFLGAIFFWCSTGSFLVYLGIACFGLAFDHAVTLILEAIRSNRKS